MIDQHEVEQSAQTLGILLAAAPLRVRRPLAGLLARAIAIDAGEATVRSLIARALLDGLELPPSQH